MKTTLAFSMGIAAVLLTATPLLSHHSFGAQYDESHSATLTGTISKVTWKNPHVQVNLDVKDDAGNVTTWDLEMGSPSILMRQGWKVDSLKTGDYVTVSGFPAKDGSPILNARKITLAAH